MAGCRADGAAGDGLAAAGRGDAGADGLADTRPADGSGPAATTADPARGREPGGTACPDIGPLAGQNASRLATSAPAASMTIPALTAGGTVRCVAGSGTKFICGSPDPSVANARGDDGA
jgi:hypothetical protein